MSRPGGFVCAFFVLLAGLAVAGRRIPSYAGSYIASVVRAFDCIEDHDAQQLIANVHLTKFNRFKPLEKQILTGNITLLQDLDDTCSIGVNVARWANNEWKKNFILLNFPGGACTNLRNNVPAAVRSVFKNDHRAGRCVINSGTYHIHGEEMDWTLPNFPQLPYGQYLLNVSAVWTKKSRRAFVYCSEVLIMPKP